jgi:hypothetical protein
LTSRLPPGGPVALATTPVSTTISWHRHASLITIRSQSIGGKPARVRFRLPPRHHVRRFARYSSLTVTAPLTVSSWHRLLLGRHRSTPRCGSVGLIDPACCSPVTPFACANGFCHRKAPKAPAGHVLLHILTGARMTQRGSFGLKRRCAHIDHESNTEGDVSSSSCRR